jgi:chitinase
MGGVKGNVNLPRKIIVGYANWNECDDKIIQAVKNGVNVLIWFSINLSVDSSGNPVITNGPNFDCVAEKVNIIRTMNLQTVHLISIGGWNSPHPDTSNSAEDVYETWNRWNREVIARSDLGFYGFDGFDWDIEGNDDPDSVYDNFTVECLDLMGKMSQFAKRDHYIVSMAPAESYLDPLRAPSFDRQLTHEYEEWIPILPTSFRYHGLNCYTYLLARYDEPLQGTTERTFDFITIQLYEGYSHALFNISQEGKSPSSTLSNVVQRYLQRFEMDFSSDLKLNFPISNYQMKLDKDRLVVGLANGWAGDGKFLLILPQDLTIGYNLLLESGMEPRGFAFWDIADEGLFPIIQPDQPLYLAYELNKILNIRDSE